MKRFLTTVFIVLAISLGASTSSFAQFTDGGCPSCPVPKPKPVVYPSGLWVQIYHEGGWKYWVFITWTKPNQLIWQQTQDVSQLQIPEAPAVDYGETEPTYEPDVDVE